MEERNILELKHISKQYTGVKALDDVSISFRRGEVHALMGENGAGKSTLIKTLSGAIQPNDGEIVFEGTTYTHMEPHQAMELGIHVIYQEFNMMPELSVAENIFMGQQLGGGVLFNKSITEERAQKILDGMHVKINAKETVKNLSVANMQLVEIAKALTRDVKVLVMDEPTAPLTDAEVETLFEIVQMLKSKGVTIIYISHRIAEVFQISDRVSVLRDGRFIKTVMTNEVDRDELIRLMVGREVSDTYPKRDFAPGEVVLELRDVCGNGVENVSIAQLYQAILEKQPHVPQVAHITTLAGYIHYRLTGRFAMGVGDASGMFPIDPDTCDFDRRMLGQFDTLVAPYGFPWQVRDLLPEVLTAGTCAGTLTEEGARLLDPTAVLRPGIPMAPPEGDAGTGMAATNSVAVRTGNVSAGTSIFSMVVLERSLRRLYRDIDIVSTPSGHAVAMVHCNNGTTEIDAWCRLFRRFARLLGAEVDESTVYRLLFEESLQGDGDCDGVLYYNYMAGEPVVGLTEGLPMLLRLPESSFTLANFMRSQLCAVMAALAVGMRILEDEEVRIDRLTGHGGIFKTPGVAQHYLAAAMGAPVSVMTGAGEGGPYGMALLAQYLKVHDGGRTLEDFLREDVFRAEESSIYVPTDEECAAYRRYLERHSRGLAAEHAAVGAFLKDTRIL